jgi:hypothetical protein
MDAGAVTGNPSRYITDPAPDGTPLKNSSLQHGREKWQRHPDYANHILSEEFVLLANHAISLKSPDGSQHHDGRGYAETLRRLREVPGCVGYHLCGDYLRNECRKRALRDAAETPDTEALAAITAANAEADRWMRAAAGT